MTGANIVQAERRKKEFTHFYPEAQPIFKAQLKISASREEKKGVYSFFIPRRSLYSVASSVR